MTSSIPKCNTRLDALFFILTTLTWMSFFSLVSCASILTVETQILFALGAGTISFLALKWFGYFSTLRLVPRRSDILYFLFAIPLGGAINHIIWTRVVQLWVCKLSVILVWTPLLAAGLFVLHYALLKISLKHNRKKLVLDLTKTERAELIEQFAAVGINSYLEYYTRGDLEDFLLHGRAHEIDLLVISQKTGRKFDKESILLQAHLQGVPIVDHRILTRDITGRIKLAHAEPWNYVLTATRQTPFLRAYAQIKSMFEPIMAVLLGMLLLPLMILVALLIKLSSRGPVLFRQERLGYLGQHFTLVKFRSMYADAEKDGPSWSQTGDSRVTPLGKVLRRTRLDELPQLWNVAMGEMSFFGPRPERPEMYKALADQVPLFRVRTLVRPGITGWAQICAGYAASIAESEMKLEYDLYYIQHMSPRLDFIILAKTLLVLFGHSSNRTEKRKRVHSTALREYKIKSGLGEVQA